MGLIFNIPFMISLQYIGDSHTLIQLPGDKIKTKVSQGEIIDLDITEKQAKDFTNRGFQLVSGGREVEAPKAKKSSKK